MSQSQRPTRMGRQYEQYREEQERRDASCDRRGDTPTGTTDDAKAGTCPGCGRWATLTSKGKTRQH